MSKPIHYFAIAFCFALGASLASAEPSAHGEHMYDSMHDEHQSGDRMPGMHEHMEDQHFKDMDSNGDGMVSKAEFDAAHDKHFKDMDSNGDGKLSPEEMRAGHKEMLEQGKNKRFDAADINHDGALTREEAKKMPMLSKHFDEVDANKDGKVTREELDAAMEKMRNKRDGKQRSGW
ncbi:MAG: EF-hand domain-containing protein [Nitrosomonadales bacterium]|nr:EF-hand domain-containing protein [Nitrosomonadales bacterium]